MTIRQGQNNDFLWLKEHDRHISEETIKYKIENKEYYIAEKEGKNIGWLRYNLFWDNIPFINLIYVLEGYRVKGTGAKLVKYWEENMKQKGYSHVLTSTQSNEEAQHFYRKLGYIEIGGFKILKEPYEIIFFKEL
jgi:N-acetylglutamate synthase-like GNAT family acetyltransferase